MESNPWLLKKRLSFRFLKATKNLTTILTRNGLVEFGSVMNAQSRCVKYPCSAANTTALDKHHS